MRYFFAHALTAIVLTAFWAVIIVLGSTFIYNAFESKDLGLIVCFGYGVILGAPALFSYVYIHTFVDDAVWRHSIKK